MVVMAIAKGAQDNRHAQQVADSHRWPWSPRLFEPPAGTEVDVEQNEIDPDKDRVTLVDTTEKLQSHLSHRWDCLARQLNLRREVIHDIRTKDTSDSDRIDLVIEKWLQHQTKTTRSQEPPTWRWLVAAIRSPAGGDNPKLADVIAEEHRAISKPGKATISEVREPALDKQLDRYHDNVYHQATPNQAPPLEPTCQVYRPLADSNEHQHHNAVFPGYMYRNRPSAQDEVWNSESVPATVRMAQWPRNQSQDNDDIRDSDVGGDLSCESRRSAGGDNIWDDDFDACINEEVEDDSLRDTIRAIWGKFWNIKQAKTQEDKPKSSGAMPEKTAVVPVPSSSSSSQAEHRRGSLMMNIQFGYYPVCRLLDRASSTGHRGICLIFCVQKYADPHLYRSGADVDVRRVQDTFARLGYRTVTYTGEKCSYEWIMSAFQKVRADLAHWSSPDQCPHDSFVCYISAHGGYCPDVQHDFIVPYDYDLEKQEPRVHLKRLQAAINPKQCPALATKPKIFFLQTCRGKEVLECVRISVQPDATVSVHENSDFFTSYSTSLENISLRDPIEGSWFTNELCDILDPSREAVREYDICTLVAEVHRRVSVNHEFSGHGFPYRQCPEVVHSLRQRFFFFEPRIRF